jgi:hypothetical protein
MLSHRRRLHQFGVLIPALLVGTLTALSTGCVGLGFAEHTEIADQIPPPLHGSKRGTISSGGTTAMTSAADVLKEWGQPDHWEWTENETQEWVYRTSGVIWTGYDVWAVILPLPLPMGIPTGSQRISLTMKMREVVGARRYHDHVEGTFFCGFLPTNILQGGHAWVCGRVRWLRSD